MKNVELYEGFLSKNHDILKYEKTVDFSKSIPFENNNGTTSYLSNDEVGTVCGKTGKISELFSNIGMDETGRFICNSKCCNERGILLDDHIDINFDK